MDSKSKRPNIELRHQRNLRGWSQKRVADAIDTSKEMVSKWERGEQVPSKYYQEKLCLLFNKSAYQLGFIREPDQPVSLSLNPSDQKLSGNNDLQGMLAQAVTQGIIGATQELGSQDLDELRRKILEKTLEVAISGTFINQIPFLDVQSLLTTSIAVFEEVLQCLGEGERLLNATLHCGLAAAYAQCGKKREALDSLSKSEVFFPSSPENDPIFRYIDCGKAEFFLRVGKVYLDLAQHYPEQGYYEQANDAFEQSIALQAMADRSTSEILIHKGTAALGMGNLELYESYLRQGLVLAKAVGSQKRLIEAQTIAQNTLLKKLSTRGPQATSCSST